ncbi:MAG: AbrB family transcriptional regulator [Thermofilum sp. ex4484_79]|nr:MAG: AbrB family transcriptional regulator [Thermofilum sp. ex4484_79]
MSIIKISSKGQITIPKKVRDALKLRPGDRVEVRVKGNYAIIEPLKKPSESMKGIGLGVKKKLGAHAVDIIHELRREDMEEL